MSKFAALITKMANMTGAQVLAVSDMTADRSGSVRIATAEQASTFAAALLRSGINAKSLTFRGTNFVVIE